MANPQHSHHPAAPTTPTPPPQPQWHPLNWSFPFAPNSGDSSDPQTWLRALAETDGGFYPLGLNGMYHGGIHFDAGTGGLLKQNDGVKVIADGEVVAYRLDSTYPELTYPTTPPRYALYSTGFVLVRHRLVLPPAPKPAGLSAGPAGKSAPASTAASANGAQASQTYEPPADDVLEFYSLYMHQLAWKGYQDAAQAGSGGTQSARAIRPLPFWKGDRHFKVGAKANGHQARPPQLNTPFAFAHPSGGLGATPSGGALLSGVVSGSVLESGNALSSSPDRVRYAVPPTSPADASQDVDTPQAGVCIFDRRSGSVIGLLPRGGELRIVGDTTRGWAQIATITKGTPVAAVAGRKPDPRAATGWINIEELDAVIDPKPLDTVVVLDMPYKVSAGDVVGYLGEYQNSSEASLLPPQHIRPLLHVEVFTGAQINDFIGKSKERATQLADDKTLLVIEQGANLVKPTDAQRNTQLAGLTLELAKGDPGKGGWAWVQPTRMAVQSRAQEHGHGHGRAHAARGTPVGNPLWVERKNASKVAGEIVQTWTAFPLQIANVEDKTIGFKQVFSRAQLDRIAESGNATDDRGAQWWLVEAGDTNGWTLQSWVCEKDHPGTKWESPWAWPGFDTVDTTAVPLIDMYRRNLFEAKQLLDGEEKEFSSVAATVNAGAFIGKLEKAAKNQGDGKGNVKPADLRRALMTPWLAGAISHLIFRYESEWGGDMSKWDALSRLMGDGKMVWQTELERIRKLQWWDEVSTVKGFPASPDIWHIHPIGLVGNFIKTRQKIQSTARYPSDVIEAAQLAQTKWQVPACVSLAQWAFESGYGHHMPPDSNNPFGIKANHQDIASGNYVMAMTTEVIRGVRERVPQPFRKFASIDDAFDYHGRLLATGSPYAIARSALPDPFGFANGLTGHYATEPNYGQKLIDGYINPDKLTQYDNF
ncbi:glucosaminidase domain-containing protein [Paraburkholderia sp. C35]|uniref:glycoside hydrolase family 73 protein n=1 Tax=Paraburkholderia sp. C35 TaxID=2126993 RepID=UPI0013A5B213|nr:glucosaminidase domain-containing protein [Paraburkholderia sp. C35]